MGPKKAIYKRYFSLFFHSTILITSFFIFIANSPGNVWAKNVYIDPTYSGIEQGTFDKPYNSWTDFTISTGNDYRQKCGTSVTFNNPLTIIALGISGNPIIIGAYNADGSFEDGGNEVFGGTCSGGLAKPELKRGSINGRLCYLTYLRR